MRVCGLPSFVVGTKVFQFSYSILVHRCISFGAYSTRYPHQNRDCESSRSPTAPSLRRYASDADIRHSMHRNLHNAALVNPF